MSNGIPKSIQAMIERAEDLQEQEALQEEVKSREEEDALVRQREEEWMSLWLECQAQLPKEIRRYATKPEPKADFHLTWSERAIPIQIPGLAPFLTVFEMVGQGDERHLELGRYRCATPYSTAFDNELGEIIWSWIRDYNFNVQVKDHKHALEMILLQARDCWMKFQAMQSSENERRMQIALMTNSHQEQREREKAEEDRLLDTIKKDPIATLFLKAFVLVQQERSGFMAEIENTNCAAESIEHRISEKLEISKRQVEDARREAEDERRKKEDLQGELEKAEKKAKRGW